MSEAGTEVTVEVDPPEVPDVPDAPDVVVVDTGDDGGGAHDLEVGIRLGNLESAVQTLAERLGAVEITAQTAETIADNAADEVGDVAEEVAEVVEEALAEAEPEPEPEPDESPTKVHWLHRRHPFRRGDGD